jgi:SAM-dependent MidA family methyltransferase
MFETPTEILIKKAIIENDGSISFYEFMNSCLTNEQFGYYSTKELSWNHLGDYQTSPEIHPIFGVLWAKQIHECWLKMGQPNQITLIEVGGGSGIFMSSIASWLKNEYPDFFNAINFILIDVSQKRLIQQKKILQVYDVHPQLMLLDDFLSEQNPFEGILISNEFYDCLPFHLIKKTQSTLNEIRISNSKENRLFYLEQPLKNEKILAFINKMNLQLFDNCIVEIPMKTYEVATKIASIIEKGYIINIDYGDLTENLLQAWRKDGTYKGITRNMLDDPINSPGEIDITADVNFSILKKGFEDNNMIVNPIITQWECLSNLGIFNMLAEIPEVNLNNSSTYLKNKKAVEKLTEPELLGKIKVQVAAKGCSLEELSYFIST